MGIRNGVWLDNQVFEEPAWSVPGILPEGCAILAGHPKIGKSFLVLGIALAAARGGEVLGVPVDQRPVLYLALEDTAKRLQGRARMLIDDDPLPAGFHFITRDDADRCSLMNDAMDWTETNYDREPLVIVDTLERFRAPRSGNNGYEDDYAAGTRLVSLLKPGGCVVAVHHTRKAESSDFLDSISGTLGLAGSVDTVIVLRRARGEASGRLSVTGRDVDEMEYSLTFADGLWRPEGTTLAAAAEKAAEPKLGRAMQDVLGLVNSRLQTAAPDVTADLGIKESTARQYLRRLADEHRLIVRISTGIYGPVTLSQVSLDDPDAPPDEREHAESVDFHQDEESADPSQEELALSGL